MNSLPEIAAKINQARKVGIAGHISPDGDSLGSMLALGLALSDQGKDIFMYSADPVPAIYNFLPGANKIILAGEPVTEEFDLFITVDCSVPERLGEHLEPILNRQLILINLDHHVSPDPCGDLYYVDERVAATGEIIMDLLDEMNLEITRDMAIALYTAIVTDSGSFRYDHTSIETHHKAARLIQCGVPVGQVSRLIFDERPYVQLKVLAAALASLKISDCGRLAWISIDCRTMEKLEARNEDADGLIKYPRGIKGVEVALMFQETRCGKIKISFRSKNDVDVNRLAAQFGGGGHVRAAGCTIEGMMSDIQGIVIKAALQALPGC